MRTDRIVVVGSVNLDHSTRVPAIARPGETLLAESVRTSAGGKSFNQAVAARLLGGEVELVAMVGDDSAGRAVLDDLRELGIRADRVQVCRDAPTGSAFISVDPAGENAIVVARGANARLTATQEVLAAVAEADVVLLALEVPLGTVAACARAGAACGAKVVLNLSPWHRVPVEVLRDCFVVVVNDHELTSLLSDNGSTNVAGNWAETAATLRHLGIERMIVTLGAHGSVLFEYGEHTRVPAVPITPVDTTGSGDAFAGAVGYALARGLDLVDAVRLGSEVGALAATRPGARSSYPTARELDVWRSVPNGWNRPL